MSKKHQELLCDSTSFFVEFGETEFRINIDDTQNEKIAKKILNSNSHNFDPFTVIIDNDNIKEIQKLLFSNLFYSSKVM